MSASRPLVRPATSLAALAAVSGLGWWYWKRVQPAIDAETAARLRVRG